MWGNYIYSWRHSSCCGRVRTWLIDDSSQHWCMCTTACMLFNSSRCTYVCIQALMRIVCWCCQETHIYYILLHYSATHQCGVELWSAGRQHSRSSCQPLTLVDRAPGLPASWAWLCKLPNSLWCAWLGGGLPILWARWRQKGDYTTPYYSYLLCAKSVKICLAVRSHNLRWPEFAF